MTMQHSYVVELETLIVDTLLPIYVKYWQAKGVHYPMQGINPELLNLVQKGKRLPALLRPKENSDLKE